MHAKLAAPVAGLTVALLLAGCAAGLMPSAAGPPVSPSPQVSWPAHTSIGVLNDGWHTGLVLPTKALTPKLSYLRRRYANTRYVVFGWGDRAYYMARHRSLVSALRALWPSVSVLYVRAIAARPAKVLSFDASVQWLCVSPSQMRRLDVFIAHYVQKTPAGRPIELSHGIWPHSAFFASVGRYDAVHTCNTWTAAALSFAGLPITSEGIVFASQLMSEIQAIPKCKTTEIKVQTAFVRVSRDV